MKTSSLRPLAAMLCVLASLLVVPVNSVWAKNGVSLGNGIKCKFVPTVQPNGSIMHVQVCKKWGV